MQSIDYVLLLSRGLHLFAAIVAVGGAAYARLALLPAVKEALDEPSRQRLHASLRKRWLAVVMTCIGVLLLTGGLNFVLLAMPPKVEPMPYHGLFGIKFLLALLIFFIASALVGRSPGLEPMRRNRAIWLSILLGLAALVVLLSGLLNQVRTSKPAPAGSTNSVSQP